MRLPFHIPLCLFEIKQMHLSSILRRIAWLLLALSSVLASQDGLADDAAIDAAIADWQSLANKHPVIQYSLSGTVLTKAKSIMCYDDEDEKLLWYPRKDVTHKFSRHFEYDLVNERYRASDNRPQFNLSNRKFERTFTVNGCVGDRFSIYSPEEENEGHSGPLSIEYRVDCPRAQFPMQTSDYAILAAHGHLAFRTMQKTEHADLKTKHSLTADGTVLDDEGVRLSVFRLHFDVGGSLQKTEIWCDPKASHRIHRTAYYFGDALQAECLIRYQQGTAGAKVESIQTHQFHPQSEKPRIASICKLKVTNANFPLASTIDDFKIQPQPSDWCIDCETARVYQFLPKVVPFYQTYTFWVACCSIVFAVVLILRRKFTLLNKA